MEKPATKIPLVAALVGSDTFLQLAALDRLLRLLPPDATRIDLDGETAQLADVLDEARSFAMFGGGKAVVVRNADDFVKNNREKLEDYVEAPSDSAMLVLRLAKLPATQRIYKAIAKVGHIEPCEAPKELAKWIIERGKAAHQLTVAFDAARLLADLIGDDLGRLDNELAKLALTVEGGAVSAKQVAQSAAFQREREMWDITNALAGGDRAGALRRWREMLRLDSSVEYRAVTWLGMWLESVRKAQPMIRRGDSAATIGQAVRIWQRELQGPFAETARAMGQRGVDRALDLLAEIDFQSKTGVGSAADNVERFILSLAVA
jgi:DNA polymerase III delta subunit